MSRNAFGVDHFQAVHFQKIPQTCQRVVAKMFVINRVVLERFAERTTIMWLGDENTIVAQKSEKSGQEVVDIFEVGENVRRRDDYSFSLFSRRLFSDVLCKKRNH